MRASEYAHLYRTYRWRRISERHRAANPLCAYCAKRGRAVAAEVADHVIPHKGDEDAFYHGKLQSLCSSCHNDTKKLEEHGKTGFDAKGNPTTPVGGWV